MLRPKTYKDEYRRVWASLIRSTRLQVAQAEDEITANPDVRIKGRYERNGYRYDVSVPGVIIQYRVLDGGTVSFDAILDVTAGP